MKDNFNYLCLEVGPAWEQFHNDSGIERWFHEAFRENTLLTFKITFNRETLKWEMRK